MSQDQITTARYLAYAGMLPPWLLMGISLVMAEPWAGSAALGYGAVIASFVCGIHWGLFLAPRAAMPINLLLTSNVGALAAWAMLITSLWSAPIGFIGLALVLGALLAIDRRLLSAGIIAPWFWVVRRNASLGLGSAMVVWSVLA